jgi:hypothetical protein
MMIHDDSPNLSVKHDEFSIAMSNYQRVSPISHMISSSKMVTLNTPDTRVDFMGV